MGKNVALRQVAWAERRAQTSEHRHGFPEAESGPHHSAAPGTSGVVWLLLESHRGVDRPETGSASLPAGPLLPAAAAACGAVLGGRGSWAPSALGTAGKRPVQGGKPAVTAGVRRPSPIRLQDKWPGGAGRSQAGL